MFSVGRPQFIFEKELRFLKTPVEGLLSYSANQADTIRLIDCETPLFLSEFMQPNQIVRRLPRLPSNNVMIIVYSLLSIALDRQDENGRKILNKIKSCAYDQQLDIIGLLEVSERGKYNEIVLKKLFVEFFHLGTCSAEKNKVEKLMYKYPIMQASFLLLLRKLMHLQGVQDAQNLQLPLPTLWILESARQSFGLRYRSISPSLYLIEEKIVIAEDSSYVYKVCESEEEKVAFDEIRETKRRQDQSDAGKGKRHTRHTSNLTELTKDNSGFYGTQDALTQKYYYPEFPPIFGKKRNTPPSNDIEDISEPSRTKKQATKFTPGHYRRHSQSNTKSIQFIEKPLLFRKQSSQFIRKINESLVEQAKQSPHPCPLPYTSLGKIKPKTLLRSKHTKTHSLTYD